MLDTAIKKEFHERIVTIDDTNDTAEVNKLPVANVYGYLDSSWLKDYSGYKIDDLGDRDVDVIATNQEYVMVFTIRSENLSICLSGNFVTEDDPFERAIVYRFLIFNPDNHSVNWISDVNGATIVWNTYSETAPTLDANGTYIEFISTDKGLTWYGNTSARTSYDIVNNYYTKTESDNRFVNATGDIVTGEINSNYGNEEPFAVEITEGNPNGEVVSSQFSGNMAINDRWRIGGGSVSYEQGFVDIATGFTATEGIYASQYTGNNDFENLTRRASLLDNEGNTSFPGNVTLGGPDVIGGKESITLTVNGDSVVTGTLNLTNNSDIAGTESRTPALIIGSVDGDHIEFDNNEIISKSDSSTPSTLYLNTDGGNVQIGDGGLTTTGDINAKSISTTEISTAITPETTDRSNKIATTEFVRNYIDTVNLVPDMDAGTVGRYLTNDGEKSYWVDYNKTYYVYYPTANVNIITVPSSYLEEAVITDVYRDGVLLTSADDYVVDQVTGKITFNDIIRVNEKIIVTLETSVKLHSNNVFDHVIVNNSTANTPDISDNSDKIATTAYVNAMLSTFVPGGGSGSGEETGIYNPSPTLTGIPVAPTASEGTSTNQIATTAFVMSEIANANHASLESPRFSGTPKAPTAASGTNTEQIATTAFVNNAVNNVINNAPSNLNTLSELATAIGNDPSFSTTVNTNLATKINRGITEIGDGNAVTSVTEDNGNITVTKESTFSLSSHTHDELYTALSKDVGTGINPIYTDANGILTASTSSVGSGLTPVYLNNGEFTASTETLGNSITPIFIDNGEFKVCNTTVGSEDTPVYINEGSVTSTGKKFSDYLPLTGGNLTGPLTIDTSISPILTIGNASEDHLEITNNGIQSKSDDISPSELHLNEDGGIVRFGNDTSGQVTIHNGVLTATTIVGGFDGSVDKADKDSEGNVISTTYAPLDSPSLSGTPTAPTAEAGDNSNTLATTAYVDNAVSNIVNSAPETLDTLNELAAALGNDPNFATTIASDIGSKLDSNSSNYISSLSVEGTVITITRGDGSTETSTTQDTTYDEFVGSGENAASGLVPTPPLTEGNTKYLREDGYWVEPNDTTYTAGDGIVIDNNIISAIDQLPDQTDNAGKFLTTNGEQVYWTDFREIKIDSVHYPEEGDTTIVLTEAQAVPSNINLYAMSVYVDGVHLNKTVDYGYNTSTRTITFLEPFKPDEIVTVQFSYMRSGSQMDDVTSVEEYEAGNGITFTENTITDKVTISAIPELPSQENNSGKFLTTNGTSTSWDNIPSYSVFNGSGPDASFGLVPAPSSTSGTTKYLREDGTWEIPPNDNTVTTINSTINGSGNAITDISSNNGIISVTKGSTFVTTDSAQTITGNKTFSGTILSTTPASTDNTTKVATTAYVNNRYGIAVEKVQNLISQSIITINPMEGSIFNLNLTNNATINISTIANGYYTNNGAIISIFIPKNTYLISWDNKIVWSEGSAPDLSNGFNIITLATANSGSTWYGTNLEISS